MLLSFFLAQFVAIADIYRGGEKGPFPEQATISSLTKEILALLQSFCAREKNYFAVCKYSTYEGKQMKYE